MYETIFWKIAPFNQYCLCDSVVVGCSKVGMSLLWCEIVCQGNLTAKWYRICCIHNFISCLEIGVTVLPLAKMLKAVILTITSALSVSAYSHRSDHSNWPPAEDYIPLHNVGLGNFEWNLVDSTHSRVQEYCNQGWNYVAAFDFVRAVLSFRSAQKLDKDCIMCRWAEAFALGPNLNTIDMPILLNSVPLAYEISQEVHETIVKQPDPVGQQEQVDHGKRLKYAQALALRYKPTVHEFVRKEQECRDAYAQIVEQMANEPDAGIFEKNLGINALMNTHPWDYWLDDSTNSPRPATARALTLFQAILPKEGDDTSGRDGTQYWDAFACHSYIHITEANRFTAPWAKYCATKLASYVTASPHLWHMGFHTAIHATTGGPDYAQAIYENVIACDMGDKQVYPLHNLETLAWLCRASLHEDCAIDASVRLTKMSQNSHEQYGNYFELPFPISKFLLQEPSTLLTFGRYDQLLDWSAATALPGVEPDMSLRAFEAFFHGAAYAKRTILNPKDALSDITKAKSYLTEILKVQVEAMKIKSSAERDLDPFYNFDGSPELGCFPLVEILKVAENELRSYIAYAEKDKSAATNFMQKAWTLQKEVPYDEPPFWYMPLGRRLGELLLERKLYENAKDVFQETLSMYPGSIAAMKGLRDICRIEEHAAYLCQGTVDRVNNAIANVNAAVDNAKPLYLQSFMNIPVIIFAIIMAVIIVWIGYDQLCKNEKKRPSGQEQKPKRKVVKKKKNHEYAALDDVEVTESDVEVKEEIDQSPEMALREVASKLRDDARHINRDHISSDTVHYVTVPPSHETSRAATKGSLNPSSSMRQRKSPAPKTAAAKKAATKKASAKTKAASSKPAKESGSSPEESESEDERRKAALNEAMV